MSRSLFSILAFVLASIFAPGTLAQVYNPNLFIRDVRNSGQWALQLSGLDYQTRVEGLAARSVLTLSFKDTASQAQSDSLEASYTFSLPQGSVVDSMYLWIGADPVRASLKNYWSAVQIYESIVKRRRDPSLLLKTGEDAYLLRIFPFARRQERKVRICFTTPLAVYGDQLVVQVPLDLTLPSAFPAGKVDARVDFPGVRKADLQAVSPPVDGLEWGEGGSGAYLTLSATGKSFTQPFLVSIANSPLARDGWATQFSRDRDGNTCFLTQVLPGKVLDIPARRRHNLLILWNASQSGYTDDGFQYRLEGSYFINVRPEFRYYPSPDGALDSRAILDFINTLSGDLAKVNLILNDGSVRAFRPKLAAYDDDIRQALSAFLSTPLRADSAVPAPAPDALLKAGLASLAPDDSATVVVIDNHLGDYYYTERDGDWVEPDSLDPAPYQSALPPGSSFYSLVSPRRNPYAQLYQKLSARNHGAYLAAYGPYAYTGGPYWLGGPDWFRYYKPNQTSNLTYPLRNLRDFLSARIFSVSMSFAGSGTGFPSDVAGSADGLYYTEAAVQKVGKLRESDSLRLTFRGTVDGKDYLFDRVSSGGAAPAGGEADVCRLWAAQKVKDLRANYSYLDNAMRQATDISLDYRILTEFTALLALEPGMSDSLAYQDDKPQGSEAGLLRRAAPPAGNLAMTVAAGPDGIHFRVGGIPANAGKAGLSLRIYDLGGRLVADLSAELRKDGISATWRTAGVRKGLYVAILRAGKYALSKRVATGG